MRLEPTISPSPLQLHGCTVRLRFSIVHSDVQFLLFQEFSISKYILNLLIKKKRKEKKIKSSVDSTKFYKHAAQVRIVPFLQVLQTIQFPFMTLEIP